jgi:hypothetical protein
MVSKPVGSKHQKENWYRKQYPVTYDIIKEPGFKTTNPQEIAFLRAVEANDVNSVNQYVQQHGLESKLFVTAHQITTATNNTTMSQLLKKLRSLGI